MFITNDENNILTRTVITEKYDPYIAVDYYLNELFQNLGIYVKSYNFVPDELHYYIDKNNSPIIRFRAPDIDSVLFDYNIWLHIMVQYKFNYKETQEIMRKFLITYLKTETIEYCFAVKKEDIRFTRSDKIRYIIQKWCRKIHC